MASINARLMIFSAWGSVRALANPVNLLNAPRGRPALDLQELWRICIGTGEFMLLKREGDRTLRSITGWVIGSLIVTTAQSIDGMECWELWRHMFGS